MALADLLAALELDAAEEAERLRAEAEAAAAGIVEAAKAEARSLAEEGARAAAAELAHELDRRRAEARLAAAALLRDTREQCFRALAAALDERLAALRETDAYAAVFEALLEEGLAALPTAEAVRIDPRDERIAAEALRALDARLALEPTLRTAGGVELASGDGRTVRNTLEERLRNAEPALRLAFGKLLDDPAGVPPLRPAAEAVA